MLGFSLNTSSVAVVFATNSRPSSSLSVLGFFDFGCTGCFAVLVSSSCVFLHIWRCLCHLCHKAHQHQPFLSRFLRQLSLWAQSELALRETHCMFVAIALLAMHASACLDLVLPSPHTVKWRIVGNPHISNTETKKPIFLPSSFPKSRFSTRRLVAPWCVNNKIKSVLCQNKTPLISRNSALVSSASWFPKRHLCQMLYWVTAVVRATHVCVSGSSITLCLKPIQDL